MIRRVMIDMETLGTVPGSVILSLGAVEFSVERGIEREEYWSVDPQSCIRNGLTMDFSTVAWWIRQGDPAKLAAFEGACALEQALIGFSVWLSEGVGEAEIWGNGANFDNCLLVAAYKKANIPLPWKFWNDRCYRTMKALRSDVRMLREGTHHNALDDARSQALHLIDIFKALGVE